MTIFIAVEQIDLRLAGEGYAARIAGMSVLKSRFMWTAMCRWENR
jgi:hypothetical protein